MYPPRMKEPARTQSAGGLCHAKNQIAGRKPTMTTIPTDASNIPGLCFLYNQEVGDVRTRENPALTGRTITTR